MMKGFLPAKLLCQDNGDMSTNGHRLNGKKSVTLFLKQKFSKEKLNLEILNKGI